MRRWIKPVSIAGLLVLGGACDDSPSAPSRFATVTAIRYERERPFDPAVTGQLSLQFNYPIAGDPNGRFHITGCALQPRGNDVFTCPELVSWQVPADAECSIQVYDPAVTTNAYHMVATAVFVNDQRVRRVEVFANGVEIARFRVTLRGGIE